jgi:hypothetical protein
MHAQGTQELRKPVKADASDMAVSRIKRAVRKAERMAGDGGEVGGTGQTVIRLSASPVQRLIESKAIGGEEVQAADEIVRVFMAISGALFPRSASLVRFDRGMAPPDPPGMIDAQARYRAFAAHWSDMAKHGHPLLAILIDALVDERGFRDIEAEHRMRNGKARKVVIAGLRDYAARAGWVSGQVRYSWLLGASGLFRLTKDALSTGPRMNQNTKA